jgi:hypothetical protein
MKSLIKLAMGAALAGVLVNMLMKKQAGRYSQGANEDMTDAPDAGDMSSTSEGPLSSYDQNQVNDRNRNVESSAGGAAPGDPMPMPDAGSVGTSGTTGNGTQDWRGTPNSLS